MNTNGAQLKTCIFQEKSELRAVDGVAGPEEEVRDANQGNDGRVGVEEDEAPVEGEPFPEEEQRGQQQQHRHGENQRVRVYVHHHG